MDGHVCKQCDKIYASYKSLWNHNKKFHINNNTINIPNIYPQTTPNIPISSSMKEDNHICINCNKKLSSYKNKWRHEQKCKSNINEIVEIKKENAEIKLLLNNILKECKIHPKTLQKINNQLTNSNNSNNNSNNTNNGIINNKTVNIVKFGSEDLASILSKSEILKILNHKMMSLEESIKAIHFNNKRPQFKNIYITNLKDKYAYVFNGNKFTVGLKSDILGELVDNHVDNIEMSMDEYKDILPPKTIEVLDKFLEKIYNDEDEFTDKEHKIKYPNFKQFKINNIKLMIYNEYESRTDVVTVICDKIDPLMT
jgi:hypothetical protein